MPHAWRAMLLVVVVESVMEQPLGRRYNRADIRAAAYARRGRRVPPPPSSLPHVQRVYAELDRSVAYFPQTTNRSDAARIVADTLSHPYGLALLNGRLFAHEGADLKTIRQFRLLLEAADRRRVQNVVVTHNAASDGRCATRCTDCSHGSHERDRGGHRLPSTLIAKKGGFDEPCGVLVPNPYFGTYRERTNATGRLVKTPWMRRQNMAFWRGRLIEPGKPCVPGKRCARDPNMCEGNLARFEGLSLTLRHPDLFDVKALSIDRAWTDKAALRNRSCLPGSFATKISKRLHRVTEPKHRPHSYYARFKMLLHFPGSTKGSYSRNLNHLWSTDATILIWKHTAVEHYYRGLEPGATHLDVDLASAPAAARAVLGDAALAERLRAGARAVVRDLVCPACLETYLAAALGKIRARHGQNMVLDDASSLRAALKGANCSGLVEYTQQHPGPEDTQLGLHKQIERRVRISPLPAATVVRDGEDRACAALVESAFPELF